MGGRSLSMKYDLLHRPVRKTYTDANNTPEVTYDVLANLTRVKQYGSGDSVVSSREFEYNSLKQLRKAVNPEKGVTRYRYDLAGNLTETKEPDLVSTAYAYDALNRLTGKSYSIPANTAATTPNAKWCYDGLTYDAGTGNCGGAVVTASQGKLTSTGNAVSKTVLVHDAGGRVAESYQHTPATVAQAQAYRFGYSYYLDDTLAAVTYPGSGRTITTCPDGLGRVVWVSGVKTAADCEQAAAVSHTDAYASGITYGAHGAMSGLRLGNGLYESTTYNTRQQPSVLGLGTVAQGVDLWGWGLGYGTQNNGNIESATLTLPGNQTAQMRHGYDGANRLTMAIENMSGTVLPATCAGSTGLRCQQYGYDLAGNRTLLSQLNALPGGAVPSGFDAANNQVTGTNWVYDGRGNLKQMPRMSLVDKMLYDGENRLRVACPDVLLGATCPDSGALTGTAVRYGYDAEGRRVTKETASGTVSYIYDAGGRLMGETGAAGAAGRRYVTVDQLGSTRVVTDGGGAVVERRDYLPFGDELLFGAGDPRHGVVGYGVDQTGRQKFTGKERDAETGLDFFGARYYLGLKGASHHRMNGRGHRRPVHRGSGRSAGPIALRRHQRPANAQQVRLCWQ
ncbi:MAG: RHS repeat protein [Bryobacterales bacterium]|nr:RHS repeat protein [Bryobacterales bacterium]